MADSWTDAELVQFCLDGPFDEIADERLASLRERLDESILVRDAVCESPASEELLRRLGLTRNQLKPRRQRSPALVLALLLCVGVGAYLFGNSQREEQAENNSQAGEAVASVKGEPGDEPVRQKPDQPGTPATIAETASDEQKPSSSSDVKTTATRPATEPAAATPIETPLTETVREPVEEVPWASLLSPDVAASSVESAAWLAPAEGRVDEFPPGEFRRWFSAIPGRPLQVTDETQRSLKYTRFDGQARLKAPWVADAVLRLTMYDVEKCSLFFWRGNEGVRLRYYRSRTPHQIAAHRILRSRPNGKPQVGAQIAHDNGRWHRSFLGPFDVRYENDELMFVRGDLPLLSVGFAGPPEEVILEGRLKLRQCTMYRSDPLPREHIQSFVSIPAPNQLPGDTPAGLEWSMMDPKSESASLKLDPVKGWVELKSGPTDKVDATSVTPLGPTGLSEFVLRVERADPGTGVVLLGEDNRPVYRVGFEWDSNGSRLAVAPQSPTARTIEKAFDPNAYPVPWTGRSQWLRIVVGAGTMSLWISESGRDWSWVGDTTYRTNTPSVTGLGLFALMGGDRSITLSHLERREFPTLYSLASPELRARVQMSGFGSRELLNIGTWMQHVIQCQPKGIEDFASWRRACAVETLRAGSNGPLATALLNGLLTETLASTEVPAGQGESDDRFLWRLLGESSQVLDILDTTMGTRFSHVVHESIRRRVLHQSAESTEPGDAHPGESADTPLPSGSVTAAGMAEFLMMPFWSQAVTLLTPQNAAQLELLSLVQQREDDRVRKLLDRLTCWNTSGHPAQAWWTPLAHSYSTMAWAELTTHRSIENEQQLARAWPGRWKTTLAPIRHPLAQTVSKEAYNVMAEFQAAISGKAFQDACQVISSSATSSLLGLLPDREDDRLMVSFPNAVSLAMDEHPELRLSMNEKFGAVGQLRVRQAIENGDADTIEAATVQFFGTIAAAESARWLGDQALAAGRFATARAHYRASLADYRRNLNVETEATAALESRLRMTEAILGLPPEPAGTAPEGVPPVDRSIHFGPVEMTAAQFAELATELRTASQANQSAVGIRGARSASSAWHISPSVPAPDAYDLQQRLQIQGDVGEHAGKSAPADVNWFARQNVVEVDGTEAFFSNRFQLTRIDLSTGKETWRQELGGEHGSVNYWPHLPMRPLLTASRVFCRRLTKTGPELICCDRAAGTVHWRYKPVSGNTLLVSDPLLVRDRLQILSQTTDATGPGIIHLLTIDAGGGNLISEVEALRMFADSTLPAHLCLATVDDDRIYFSVSGTVACCDTYGQCVWVRQQSWTPTVFDTMRRIRAWQPPLVHDEFVLATQPGIDGVDCLERSSGRILWSRMLPGLKRVIGLAENQLLIERRDGLESLDPQNGQSQWHYRTTSLLNAVLVGLPAESSLPADAADQSTTPWILATRWRQLPKNIMEARLVWLDRKTGEAVAEHPLSSLNSREVALGPFLTNGEKTWVFGTQSRKEPRRILYEVVKSEAGSPTPLIDSSWAAWMPELRDETFYPPGTYAEPYFTRTGVVATLADGMRSVSPGWVLQATPQPKNTGFRPEALGQKNVMAFQLAARSLTPAQLEDSARAPIDAIRLFRKVKIPDSPTARLTFKVGHEPKQSWKLSVCHEQCQLFSAIINDETAPGGWQTISVDLGKYAGRTTHLVITCSAETYPSNHWVYLQGPTEVTP